MALAETHIPHDTFGFPGWTVFASPRKLKKTAGDTTGGVAILLRGLLLRSLVKEYLKNDGLPPECVALEFPAHVFGTIGQNVVILVVYVTRPGKVANAYKQKYGLDLFSLISRFIIELRNHNKQVILLGDLNAYTTDAIGWNGRDALWSDTADVNFCRKNACVYKSIDGNGRDLLRLCQAGELRILNGLSWPGGPALDSSPTRPPTESEASDRKRSTFDTTTDLMRRLTASSFQFALQFVANNIGRRSTPRDGDESGSVLDYAIASSSVITRVRSLTVLPSDGILSDNRPLCFSWEGSGISGQIQTNTDRSSQSEV